MKNVNKEINLNKSFIILPLLALSFVVSIFILNYGSTLNDFGFTNLFFVDGVNWTGVCVDLLYGKLTLWEIRSSWLLFLFYSSILFSFGVFGSLIVNYLLIAYFVISAKIRLLPFLLFAPFFIISSLLPNKEILTLVLTLLYFNSLFKLNYFAAFVFSLCSLLVRDAHGVFLMIILFLFIIGQMKSYVIILSLTFSVIVDNFLFYIQENFNFFMLERTLGAFSSHTFQAYPVRLFANISNAASRFTLFSNTNNLSLTGISLMLSGIGILMSFALSFRRVFIQKQDSYKAYIFAFTFLMSVVLFSISPLIQSRYLIPLALVYLNYEYQISERKLLSSIFIFSIIFATILRISYISSIGLPIIENYSFDIATLPFPYYSND